MKSDSFWQVFCMLKLAHAWRKDAEALKRGQELQPASSPRNKGAVRNERRDLHLSNSA